MWQKEEALDFMHNYLTCGWAMANANRVRVVEEVGQKRPTIFLNEN